MGVQTPTYSSSHQYVCKDGKMYHIIYATSDCTGVLNSETDTPCLNHDDCTSICDQDPCEYIKETSYDGVTSCDPIVLNSTIGTVVTGVKPSGGMLGTCTPISDEYSAVYFCDHNDSSAQMYWYSSNDCTDEPTYYDYFLSDRCDADNGNAATYYCDIVDEVNEPIINSFLTQTPETIIQETITTITEQESCDNECVGNNDELCSPFTKVHKYITYCEYCFKNDGVSSECRKMDENGEYKWEGTEFEEDCFIDYCIGKGAQIENCDKIGINVTKYNDEGCGCNMLLYNDASSFGIFVVMVFVHVVGMLSWM
eukprot:469303_1